MNRTGIFVRESDTTQPYRVYWDGQIIFFCKTFEEAARQLAKEKSKHK